MSLATPSSGSSTPDPAGRPPSGTSASNGSSNGSGPVDEVVDHDSSEATPDGPLEDELDEAFDRLVEEGTQRLARTWPDVLITGFFGGTEIGVGVLALVLVYYETDSILLGGLAFSIGFLALLLARSELFTEAFLLPVIAVASARASVAQLGKLWGGVLVTNLVGGWAVMWLIVWGYPDFHDVVDELAEGYLEAGLSLEGISLALLGGAAITLMTRMQSGSADSLSKIISAIAIAFLLGAGHLYHLIVGSLILFGSIHIGDSAIGYTQWLGWFWWVLIANMAGGLGLVTLLRLARSKDRIEEERSRVLREKLTPGPAESHADAKQQRQRERREQRREENVENQRKAQELDELDELDTDQKAERFREAGPHSRDHD